MSFVHVKPTPEQRARLGRRVGRPLAKTDYVFYVATTHGKVDGYALFDEERGQHELISFGLRGRPVLAARSEAAKRR